MREILNICITTTFMRNLDRMNHYHVMHLLAAYSPRSPSRVGDPE